MVEHGLFGSRTVFTPIGSQHIFLVHQRPPLEIISEVIKTVVVQTIRQQRRVPVYHLYIFTELRNLSHSIIVKIITVNEQRISLLHTYITESLN